MGQTFGVGKCCEELNKRMRGKREQPKVQEKEDSVKAGELEINASPQVENKTQSQENPDSVIASELKAKVQSQAVMAEGLDLLK